MKRVTDLAQGQAVLKLAREMGMDEDTLADALLANLADTMLPYVARPALARALERLAVKLMDAPPDSERN